MSLFEMIHTVLLERVLSPQDRLYCEIVSSLHGACRRTASLLSAVSLSARR